MHLEHGLSDEQILGQLRTVHLFRNLKYRELKALYRRSRHKFYARYSTIIREGNLGECFYLLLQGKVRVVSSSIAGGLDVVLGAGSAFGEGALITQVRREASVFALDDCYMLQLTADDVEGLPVELEDVRVMVIANILQKVQFFAPMPKEDRERLGSITELRYYKGGEVIFREGEPGDTIYILVEGHVSMWRSSAEAGEDTAAAAAAAATGALGASSSGTRGGVGATSRKARRQSVSTGQEVGASFKRRQSVATGRGEDERQSHAGASGPAQSPRTTCAPLAEDFAAGVLSTDSEIPFLGELAILGVAPRKVTARCDEPSKLLALHCDHFGTFVSLVPLFKDMYESASKAHGSLAMMMKQKEEMGVALLSSLQSAMKGRLTIEQQKLEPLTIAEMKWERLVGSALKRIKKAERNAAKEERDATTDARGAAPPPRQYRTLCCWWSTQ